MAPIQIRLSILDPTNFVVSFSNTTGLLVVFLLRSVMSDPFSLKSSLYVVPASSVIAPDLHSFTISKVLQCSKRGISKFQLITRMVY